MDINTTDSSPVTELTASDVGCWLVTTQGSEHLWDIYPDGSVMYKRVPGPGRQTFAYDTHFVPLSRVQKWPVVDDMFFIWFDDLDNVLLEHWRQSSRVKTITRHTPENPVV